ncbi:MAG TPA: TetR/AcrR family transcriptional regulator [Solirubrobacteraceae bacterium]|nr:TetR/AcrR family transcriptional regulator [Solirubrobacteraceae bacterium]
MTMDPGYGKVKAKRSYDASRRRARAERNHARIVESAERLFRRNGYAATTIAAIAGDSGVSVDTIYKSFGGKAGLVRAIRAQALEGEGPVPAEQRSDELHGRESDARAIIEAWGALSAEVAPRVSPILLLIRDAAAIDPEGRSLLEELDADRLRRMTQNARRLHDVGLLRSGVTLAEAADVLWTFSSPELYELIVLRRGWTPERYGTFIAQGMINALL